MTVWMIREWPEKFETSESRKYKKCSWFAERNDFSTGWYAGLEEFGPEKWAPIFAAFIVLCKIASRAKVRGVLAGEKGEPYSLQRITLESGGLTHAQMEAAYLWAQKAGWLVEHTPESESPGTPGDHREKTRPTEQNRTEHNPTERNGTERENPADPIRFQNSKNETPTAERKTAAVVSFKERIAASKLLNALALEGVAESTKPGWHGGVFCNLKPAQICDPNSLAAFCEWYTRQWHCPAPEFRTLNAAELTLVVAAKLAAARMKDTEVRKNRLAVWISSIRCRESARITAEEIDRAADFVCEWLKIPRPEVREAPPRPSPPDSPAVPRGEKQRTQRSLAAAFRKNVEPEPVQ